MAVVFLPVKSALVIVVVRRLVPFVWIFLPIVGLTIGATAVGPASDVVAMATKLSSELKCIRKLEFNIFCILIILSNLAFRSIESL